MTQVVIVGGGVVGLSLAYELARAGDRVQVLERGAAGQQSSWAGAGIFPPAPPRPANPLDELFALGNRLHVEWAERLRSETGVDNGYFRCGALHFARGAAAASRLEADVRSLEADGIEVERLSREQFGGMEPALSSKLPIDAAYHLPGEVQIRNPWHLRALVAACKQRGVEIIEQAGVNAFEQQGGRVIAALSERGRFAAERFCICGGAWSGQLAELLGASAQLKPIRGQIALLNPGRRVLTHVLYETAEYHYLVPRSDGRVLVGSTLEDAGFDSTTTPPVIETLLEFAYEVAPELRTATVEKTWAGLRPGTRDGLPYLGRVGGCENAFVAAGHYRSGLQLSPATAVVMSQLMRGERPAIELAPFALDRAS